MFGTEIYIDLGINDNGEKIQKRINKNSGATDIEEQLYPNILLQ